VLAYQFDVSVRPYTLRKGDTLDSIAKKRGTLNELVPCTRSSYCRVCKYLLILQTLQSRKSSASIKM